MATDLPTEVEKTNHTSGHARDQAGEHDEEHTAEHAAEEGYLSDEEVNEDDKAQMIDEDKSTLDVEADNERATPVITFSPTDDDESFDAILARAGLPKVNTEEYRREAADDQLSASLADKSSAALHEKMMTLMSESADDEDARSVAEAIAKQLLVDLDLPVMTRVHAQMVLGCSQDEDALDRMRDAVALLKAAIEDGEVGKEEGEKLIKTCVALVGSEMEVNQAAGDVEKDGLLDV